MKPNKIALTFLLSAILWGCSQEKIVELPLTLQNGYGPFKMGFAGMRIVMDKVGYKSYPFQGEEFTTKAAISLESLNGKYVFLDFWAEWCAPCIAEFPHLKELYSKTDRTKFEIIGIAGQSTPNGIKRLIEQHEITWSQILSDDIVKMYGITSFPTTILLDTEGIIIAKNWCCNILEEEILRLVSE